MSLISLFFKLVKPIISLLKNEDGLFEVNVAFKAVELLG